MQPPLTKSQIERLGVRLIRWETPAEADLGLLHQVLGTYSDVLAAAVERVRDGVGVSPTSRIKNTGTILEKLRRNGGHGLKSIQDLAGMRIVERSDRRGQDALVRQLVDVFGEDPRPPRIVDRRGTPVNGYRAVHVIACPEDIPVEIQVRTRWQHEWAELFEKLADRVGRGIRYGEPPTRSTTPTELEATPETIDAFQILASAEHDLRVATVRLALSVAEMIDAVEIREAVDPKNAELAANRRTVNEALGYLRKELEEL